MRDYTAALQQDLADAGYFEGEIDGVYGPETEAVEALQEGQPAAGDRVDGQGDPRRPCAPSWRPPVALPPSRRSASTAACRPSRSQGMDGPEGRGPTRSPPPGRQEFQTDLGLEPTGQVDAATIAAFEQALAEAQATPTPSASSGPPTQSPGQPSDEPSPVGSASLAQPAVAELTLWGLLVPEGMAYAGIADLPPKQVCTRWSSRW